MIFSKLFDLIYPPRCPVCETLLPWYQEKRICQSCLERLNDGWEDRCNRCSKPIPYGGDQLCYDCQKKEVAFERGWALWLYEPPIVDSIYRFKYQYKKDYASYYAKELVINYQSIIHALNIDGLVPVPLHRKRLRQRGYNQAYELAKALSKELTIPVEPLLDRMKETRPQKNLNNKQRRANLEQAFKLNSSKNTFKNLLIIDDIYTTGSTINACAKTLKQQLDVKIYFLCLCIGRGF